VTGTISSPKPAIVDRVLGAAQALDRVIVHLLAGELIFVGGALGEAAHRAAFLVGVLEPVEEHVVVGLVVADPRAERCLVSRYGALVMLSMPPATITSALPVRIASSPMITVCMPEPQTLLTVVAWTLAAARP
jgi:hypothetical protein